MATKAKKKRRCKVPKSETKSGKPCGAHPLKPGTVIEGVAVSGDYCRSHDPDLPDNARIQGAQPGAGRPRKVSPDQILRERIEAEVDAWLAPVEAAALGAERPMQMWDAHEGRHKIVMVADPQLALKAIKFAYERAFGRPRQQIEVAGGGDGAPLRISAELLTDPELREDLRAVKRRIADARPGRPVGAGSGDRSSSDG